MVLLLYIVEYVIEISMKVQIISLVLQMDTRYLISNSKDQSIKLWDMRRFAKESTVEEIRSKSNDDNYDWDYRYEPQDERRTQ